jgi:hypothetical protein
MKFAYIPHVAHIGKVDFGHFHGERLDLACPQGRDAVPFGGQGKSADAVKQACHGEDDESPPSKK